MPKSPRLTADKAEKMLLEAGFTLLRSKGSHRVYGRNSDRFILPFHAGKILHPRIILQLLAIVTK